MPYISKITEQKPSLIILLVDQSGSMNEQYGGAKISDVNNKTKAQIVAEASNIMLMDLMARCRQGAVHKRYFDIATIGYSGKGVYPLIHESRFVLSPTEMIATIKKEEKIIRKVKHTNGTNIIQHNALKIWIEPYAEGQTPMCKAFEKSIDILQNWKSKQNNKDAFPPIIINITDGEITDATDQRMMEIKQQIQRLGTLDGEPIIFNFHISAHNKEKIIFPQTTENIPQDAELLCRMSSILPPMYNEQVATFKNDVDIENNQYKAFSYNLPTADFIKVLSIGTATTKQISK